MLKNKKIILLEIVCTILLSLVFSQGTGNIFAGDINLLDEGQFAAWAFQMLHGKLMYRDLFIMYGPLFVYPLYILYKIFGVSFFLLRIYFWISALSGIIAVYVLCLQLKLKRFTRIIICLLLILLPIMQIRQAAALWTLVIFFVANKKKSRFWFGIAGILTTLVILISPEVGIFLIIAILVFFTTNIFHGGKYLKFLLDYTFGFTVTIFIFYLWSAHEGWFLYYFSETLEVLKTFSGINAPLGKNLESPLSIFSHHPSLFETLKFYLSKELIISWTVLFYIGTSLYYLVRFILRILSRSDTMFIPIFLLGVLLYVSLVGRSDIGHYYFMLPFIFLLGGYFFEHVVTLLRTKKLGITIKMILIIILLFMIAIPTRLLSINRINIIQNYKTLASYSKLVPISSKDPVRISKNQKELFSLVQEVVENHTNKNDTIFILNDEPAFYPLISRNDATEFDLPYIANLNARREILVNELTYNRPKIIIEDKNAWAVDDVPNKIRLPEVIKFIKQNYNVYTIQNGLVFYTLKKV